MSLPGKIETIANIATICVTALLSAVLVKVYLMPSSPPRNAPVATVTAVGANLKSRLPGVDWRKNGRTLVLALSTQCHFCTDSAPFLRRVQQEAGKKVKLVAVLPQPVAEGEQYLTGEGVHVDQVRQAPLGTIGVRGTPTMLLVNGSGTVMKVWTGKVQTGQEDQVLAALVGASY